MFSGEIGAAITALSDGLCYHVCGAPFKEEVRNSYGCGGELSWNPWPKETQREDESAGEERDMERAPFHWRIKKTLAQTAPLNENKGTVFLLEDQQRECFLHHDNQLNQDELGKSGLFSQNVVA